MPPLPQRLIIATIGFLMLGLIMLFDGASSQMLCTQSYYKNSDCTGAPFSIYQGTVTCDANANGTCTYDSGFMGYLKTTTRAAITQRKGYLVDFYCTGNPTLPLTRTESIKLDTCIPGDLMFACDGTTWTGWGYNTQDGSCAGAKIAPNTHAVDGCNICSGPSCKTSDSACDFYSCFDDLNECTEKGYALGFGLVNCNRYLALEPTLSAIGQTWSKGVRLCLQQELSKLNPAGMSCDEIWNTAVSSHNGCYIGSKSPTWCDLPYSDQWSVIKVATSAIKEALPSVTHALGIGVQGFNLYKDCGKQSIANVRVAVEASVDQVLGKGEALLDNMVDTLKNTFLDQFPSLSGKFDMQMFDFHLGSVDLELAITNGNDDTADSARTMAQMFVDSVNAGGYNTTYPISARMDEDNSASGAESSFNTSLLSLVLHKLFI